MAHDSRDDRTLMNGIAEGDTTALQALYDRHSGQVLALCLRILRDRARAEEVTGDVFWELWDRADRYRPDRGAPVAYVLTLSRSRAIDRLRSARREEPTGAAADVAEGLAAAGADAPRRSAARAGGALATGAEAAIGAVAGAAGGGMAMRDAGPFESAAASELRGRVQRALAGLSEAERRAVEMSFFDGLSHGEIANALREPLGTIKSRIRQGLLRLRDALAGEYGTMGTA
jgi:RNA polymerase sigma-70 factor, ECF subfamily